MAMKIKVWNIYQICAHEKIRKILVDDISLKNKLTAHFIDSKNILENVQINFME